MSTIDPGMEDGVKESANDVDDKPKDELEERQEDDYLQPSRWWFASTACPLLAGTLGPMASAFNICALVHHWRQTVPPGAHAIIEEGHSIPDPNWLVAINAVSLVAALVGNGSLLLNMAHRVKFSVAQPITISGFLIAGILLIADVVAIATKPHYGIQQPDLLSPQRHALTQAFYYAIWAAAIYVIIGSLGCLTVFGAIKGYYSKDFHLTSSQRSLMLQNMSFFTYLMIGALVFCYIEDWDYLDAVYWADVTLLTVGLGDYSPKTSLGRGLLFPFALGGVLILGLVIGSIRSLVLERGKEKMSARIVEKKRNNAVHNVDGRRQTIKISMFASADFSMDPALSPAQKREEEFNIMRKVQDASERERAWFALAISSIFTLLLWLVGAVVFMSTESGESWTYLEAVYFSYTSLLTIGYGDFSPQSNCGKAFFVVWSLLAVPSLTILISNMGDTIVAWFTSLTNWVGSLTVLPGEGGFRASVRSAVQDVTGWFRDTLSTWSGPGLFGAHPMQHEKRTARTDYENAMLDHLAQRLTSVVDEDDLDEDRQSKLHVDALNQDIQFYHYVLARECRNLQKDLSMKPAKKYEWSDWEYFLKLMGDEDDPEDYPGQQHPDIMVPDQLRAPKHMNKRGAAGFDEKDETHTQSRAMDGATSGSEASDNRNFSSSEDPSNKDVNSIDGNVDRRTSVLRQMTQRRKERKNHRPKHPNSKSKDFLLDWSWLSNESPLMSSGSEAEWILERLSAALERELNRQRKGYRRKPPIGLHDARRTKTNEDAQKGTAEGEAHGREQRGLEEAAKGAE